jgi:hypothetical protein
MPVGTVMSSLSRARKHLRQSVIRFANGDKVYALETKGAVS